MSPPDMSFPRIRVAAVIVEHNAVLLALHEKNGRRTWVLPGGGVDSGETMLAALQRELREELDLDVIPRHIVHLCEAIDPGGKRHLVQVAFLCDRPGAGPVRATGKDPRVVDARFMPLDSLPRLAMHPPIQRDLVDRARAGFPDRISLPVNRWIDQ